LQINKPLEINNSCDKIKKILRPTHISSEPTTCFKMTKLFRYLLVIGFIIGSGAFQASAEGTFLDNQLKKGSHSFGLQVGLGFSDDPFGVNENLTGKSPTDITFLFFFPNFQYNLTGLVGKSWYQGTLNWHFEAGFASILNRDGEYLLGASPLMLQYKFLNPKRNWAPNILMGAGVSYTDWEDVADRELGGRFQFLLHAGTGLEFFREGWSYSINYRLFHVSNAGTDSPNVGLNTHTFNLGIQF
jgi:lipid A 3-O-deacylase